MAFQLIDIFLHLDKYLNLVVSEYSSMTYAILFLIIFMETGLVITPFLPGDSLLFVIGAISATGALRIEIVFLVIFIAAVIGDALNYHIGKYIGPAVFKREDSLLFNKQYLIRTKSFYEKYGAKTIIISRFIPFIRTFAPFVAGIGAMQYTRFLIYNVIGAALWCGIFIFGGYLFGNIPLVQKNFTIIMILIIFISICPLLKELIAHYNKRQK